MHIANGMIIMNRRQFLKSAFGAAMAAPYFIPTSVLGRNGTVAPSNRITIGCIGVGGMGTANMKSFLGNPNAQVLAVCDVDTEHRHEARAVVNKTYGNQDCAAYNDFHELLARDDIDAVMIATPDHWHGLIAVAAARARKDIYGEKPLAYTLAEGRAIVDAVQRYGVVWQTGSWQRSQRNFRFACELVRNGRLGEVHTVRVGLPQGNEIDHRGQQPAPVPAGFDYDLWLGPAPWTPYNPSRCHYNFRWISDYSGGQITDWAGHHCDIANWGMNTESSAPVEIEGKGVFPKAEDGLFDTAESYYFECKYAEGFTLIVADEKQQPKGMGTHFLGSEGWLYIDRSGIEAHPRSILKSVIGPNEIHLYESTDHVGNFLDCVRSRAKTATPAEVAHHSIMIGHLGLVAIKLGRKVRWNLKAERFVNDPEADRMLSRPMRSPWSV
ncbi:Gfo/Idh/MocA family oxidoreductase [candidate division KSB1 bacterium]|nr:Gfo/Idh/MocA family oxidoreductase [candidate division KSB1 bacterium]